MAKVRHLTAIFASLAALAHVLFFLIESVLLSDPEVYAGFGLDAAGAETVRVFLFNQGFYNLFLAAGAGAGLWLLRRGRVEAGAALLVFSCLYMVGAAVVLIASAPTMVVGALIQGGPPLLCLVFLRLESP